MREIGPCGPVHSQPSLPVSPFLSSPARTTPCPRRTHNTDTRPRARRPIPHPYKNEMKKRKNRIVFLHTGAPPTSLPLSNPTLSLTLPSLFPLPAHTLSRIHTSSMAAISAESPRRTRGSVTTRQ